jgi:predicted nucleotidyltransferase
MDHRALIERLIEACAMDRRIPAAFLGGSRARGEADEFSDVDVSLVVEDEAYADLAASKRAYLETLGEPLFAEDFGNEGILFVIFADGVELELNIVRRSELPTLRPGPHEALFDPDGILSGLSSELSELDRSARVDHLRRILLWFWHDLGHFTAAIGRGQVWWAVGQLEQLRGLCVDLVRIGEDVAVEEDDPYFKLDAEVASPEALDELRGTFVPLELDAITEAGRSVLEFFRRRAPEVARANGLGYPVELDRLVGFHLDRLVLRRSR